MSQWTENTTPDPEQLQSRSPFPTELRPISQCNKSLNFHPLDSWPSRLPALAIQSVIIAGFQQNEFAVDHGIDLNEEEAIADFFHSLHPNLTFIEIVRLIAQAPLVPWFPLSRVLQKYPWQANDLFLKIAHRIQAAPWEFQQWCAEKKLAPQDLACLLSAQDLDLTPVFEAILRSGLSKSLGVKALELSVELLLMGRTPAEITAGSTSDLWVEALALLRNPETAKRDKDRRDKMLGLPWPTGSQAKWVRQGDRAGIELKLFFSHSSDFKKHLQALDRVQSLFDFPSSENRVL